MFCMPTIIILFLASTYYALSVVFQLARKPSGTLNLPRREVGGFESTLAVTAEARKIAELSSESASRKPGLCARASD
jgi:hypothetical protein